MASQLSSSVSPGTPLPKRKRWQRWGAELGVAILIVLALQWWQARDVPHGPAPAFAAAMADGRDGSLAKWRASHPDKVVGIYFWADWCPICKAQEGNVAALRADWPVLTVAMQSGTPAQVARVLHERNLDWPTVVDADGAIATRYGLHGVPALVVVDSRGEMRSVAVGYTTTLGMRLRLWWASLGG
jgi:thiol:disulfide interchange protein